MTVSAAPHKESRTLAYMGFIGSAMVLIPMLVLAACLKVLGLLWNAVKLLVDFFRKKV